LTDTTAIPLLVHAASRDSVEALNSLLRTNGMAVYCTWIPSVDDIADALVQLNPELLITFDTEPGELTLIASVRDQMAPSVPLIVLRDHSDQEIMAADMSHGAHDSATLRQPERVTAVVRRELRAFRMERTLTNTLNVAQNYRQQLQTVLRSSKDAIVQVQEGIVVDANASWLELFGYTDNAAVIGQPVMDFFDADTQAPLRGALAACAKGRWSALPLKAGAVLADRSVAPLQLVLSLGEFDGEPCVQLLSAARRGDELQMASELAAAVHQDSSTGLWARRRLLELMQEQLRRPVPGGARFLVCVRPDRLADIEREVGILHTDEFLTQFAAVVRAAAGQNDLLGHFGGVTLALLAERGNTRDIEAWSESLIEKVSRHPFHAGDMAVHATCSVGICVVSNQNPDLNHCATVAQDFLRRARERGGNQVVVEDQSDEETRVRAYDEVWVRHIKAALAENRFRLVQQPVASLVGGQQQIFDVALRMLDLQGKDVLPGEFFPAAARNDLLRNIDRWVVSASLATIARSDPDLLFVRVSRDSMIDSSFVEWLSLQLRQSRADPQRLCLQFAEQDVAANGIRVRQLLPQLRELQVRVAIEHFGTRPESLTLLHGLALDYLKIDGSLMQGLAGSPVQQDRIRAITDAAARLKIQTVAEHIEDANTMAVVWQLGVQFIQGYLVHAPEEVVLTS
jgi:diguanylate cyclase (GGDEF)-like protein